MGRTTRIIQVAEDLDEHRSRSPSASSQASSATGGTPSNGDSTNIRNCGESSRSKTPAEWEDSRSQSGELQVCGSILEKLSGKHKRAVPEQDSTDYAAVVINHQQCDRFNQVSESNNSTTPAILNTLEAFRSTHQIKATISCVTRNASDPAVIVAKKLALSLQGKFSQCSRATDAKTLLEKPNAELQQYTDDETCMLLGKCGFDCMLKIAVHLISISSAVVLDYLERDEEDWSKIHPSNCKISAKVVFVLVRSDSASNSRHSVQGSKTSTRIKRAKKPFQLPGLSVLDAWKVVSADVSSPRTPWIHIAPVPDSLALPKAMHTTDAHSTNISSEWCASSSTSGFHDYHSKASGTKRGFSETLDENCTTTFTDTSVPLRRASSCSAEVNPCKTSKPSMNTGSVDDSVIGMESSTLSQNKESISFSGKFSRRYTHQPQSSLLYASLNGIHDFSKTRASYVAAQYAANFPHSEDHHFAYYDEDSGASVFGVLDGHGTDRCSIYAAGRLATLICKKLTRAGDELQLERALKRAFIEFDEEFAQMIAAEKEIHGIERLIHTRGVINAGCCAIVAVVKDGILSVANAGDCRAVLATTDIREIIANSFSSRKKVVAVPMSEDHNAGNPSERALVSARCSDPLPFRLSSSDYRSGARGPSRIAGTLAVTRALGDVYLKYKHLTTDPYSSHVPYITCEPDVTTRRLRQGDCYLVLASDGIWENISSQDAVEHVLEGSVSNGSGFGTPHAAGVDMGITSPLAEMDIGNSPTNGAERIIHASLKQAAASRGYGIDGLRKLKRQDRRQVHDDCTALVIAFSHAGKELKRLGLATISQKSTLKDFWENGRAHNANKME